MRTIKIPGGEVQIMEPGDRPVGAGVVVSEDQERVLAAVATIAKESPAAFADELAKVKAKPSQEKTK